MTLVGLTGVARRALFFPAPSSSSHGEARRAAWPSTRASRFAGLSQGQLGRSRADMRRLARSSPLLPFSASRDLVRLREAASGWINTPSSRLGALWGYILHVSLTAPRQFRLRSEAC